MKTVFIFSGQGAQYCGMGKELYDNFEICREVFDIADNSLDFKISDMCFNENENINKTEFTQPAILTMSIAVFKLMEQKGIKADFLAGLSLGEYSALVASKALDFNQAVELVRKRGKFMTEAIPSGKGAMTAVLGLDAESIKKVCSSVDSSYGKVMIANYNAPGQIVIAGDIEAVEKAEEILKENGVKKAVRLNVSGPFHTPLLKPASEKLNAELKKIDINDMEIPVFTNLTGEIIQTKDDIIDILTKQIINPVKWEHTINNMVEMGADTFIEMGPGRTLSAFVKKINKNVKIYNVEDMKSFEKTCKGIGLEC